MRQAGKTIYWGRVLADWIGYRHLAGQVCWSKNTAAYTCYQAQLSYVFKETVEKLEPHGQAM
jgi:hypothetical protein